VHRQQAISATYPAFGTTNRTVLIVKPLKYTAGPSLANLPDSLQRLSSYPEFKQVGIEKEFTGPPNLKPVHIRTLA